MKSTETLFTDRLILRALSPDDAADIFEYSRNPNVGPNAGWMPHQSLEQTRQILKDVFLDKDNIWGIVRKSSPTVIGSVGIITDPKRSENSSVLMLGYALGFPYWGNGIMTEAVRAVCQYGFQTFNLNAISAYTFPANARLESVLRKNGFQYEGTLKMVEYSWDEKELLDNKCFLLVRKPDTGST